MKKKKSHCYIGYTPGENGTRIRKTARASMPGERSRQPGTQRGGRKRKTEAKTAPFPRLQTPGTKAPVPFRYELSWLNGLSGASSMTCCWLMFFVSVLSCRRQPRRVFTTECLRPRQVFTRREIPGMKAETFCYEWPLLNVFSGSSSIACCWRMLFVSVLSCC